MTNRRSVGTAQGKLHSTQARHLSTMLQQWHTLASQASKEGRAADYMELMSKITMGVEIIAGEYDNHDGGSAQDFYEVLMGDGPRFNGDGNFVRNNSVRLPGERRATSYRPTIEQTPEFLPRKELEAEVARLRERLEEADNLRRIQEEEEEAKKHASSPHRRVRLD